MQDENRLILEQRQAHKCKLGHLKLVSFFHHSRRKRISYLFNPRYVVSSPSFWVTGLVARQGQAQLELLPPLELQCLGQRWFLKGPEDELNGREEAHVGQVG